jgi:hypothetical protein
MTLARNLASAADPADSGESSVTASLSWKPASDPVNAYQESGASVSVSAAFSY